MLVGISIHGNLTSRTFRTETAILFVRFFYAFDEPPRRLLVKISCLELVISKMLSCSPPIESAVYCLKLFLSNALYILTALNFTRN